MLKMRRCLRTSSNAVLALAAPLVAVAALLVARIRARQIRSFVSSNQDGVVVDLRSRRLPDRKTAERHPAGGATILLFPTRRAAIVDLVEQPALTGSS